MTESSKTFPELVKDVRRQLGISQEELAIIQREFDRLYDPNHPVRNNLETLDSVDVVRTIREALKK